MAWLALAGLIAYANACWGVFQFDDYNVIVFNEAVHSWADWSWRSSLEIRPLLKASYVMDWAGEDSTWRYHLSNILIHLANAWVVWALARAWLRAQRPAVVHGQCIPLVVALLFVLHPANTEAVTYISGRSSSLMALVYGLGLLAYAQGRVAAGAVARYLLLGIAVPVLMVGALAVKETAITFPLALLLWELACGGSPREAWRRLWPVGVLALAAAGFMLLNSQYIRHLQTSAELNSMLGNLATQAQAHAWLLGHWLVPLWPNIDPDLPLRHSLQESRLSLLLLLAVPAGAAWAWQRHRTWGFALAWWWLQLVPLYIFFPRLDVANERQLYLAAWPLGLAMACTLSDMAARRPNLAPAVRLVVATVCIAMALLTIDRNRAYASEIALWEQTATVSPGKARVHNNLGYAYMLAGRMDDAKREYLLALSLDSGNVKARMNLMRLSRELP